MIQHWFTTGWRSLVANPLFSLITIISLSIGCCGALLVGANIKQHLAFDRWIPGAERTFLITRDLDENSLNGSGGATRVTGIPRLEPTTPGPMREALEKALPD